MDYREYEAPQLASLVHCIWTLEGSAAEFGGEAQPIVPDGRPELIVHFGDAFERLHPGGRFERQPAVIFAGQLTSQIVLRPTGRIAILGVRFHPHGAAALFHESQAAFIGLTIAVDDISKHVARAVNEVRESARALHDAAGLIQRALIPLVDPPRVDVRIARAVAAIQRRHGCIPIDTVASLAGTTRRHLERRFNEVVGIAPKRLARIARFQHALRVLEGDGAAQGGAYTAAACGYADQAHFVRECRELCGEPPTAHLLHRAELTGFFLE